MKTLNQVLAKYGFTTKPSSKAGRKVIMLEGVEVMEGTASEVWKHLKCDIEVSFRLTKEQHKYCLDLVKTENMDFIDNYELEGQVMLRKLLMKIKYPQLEIVGRDGFIYTCDPTFKTTVDEITMLWELVSHRNDTATSIINTYGDTEYRVEQGLTSGIMQVLEDQLEEKGFQL